MEKPSLPMAESGFCAITRPSVDHDHCYMTDSATDDYGEWLRLAEEAFRTMAEDGRIGVDPRWWR